VPQKCRSGAAKAGNDQKQYLDAIKLLGKTVA